MASRRVGLSNEDQTDKIEQVSRMPFAAKMIVTYNPVEDDFFAFNFHSYRRD